MALEIAPAPAQANPAKSTAQAAARTDSADRGAKPTGHGKSAQAADPAGFLALLMGLGQEPVPDASADPTELASDATEPDGKDLKADLAAALPAVLPTTPLPDTAALPAVALPGAHQAGAHAEGLSGDVASTLALDSTDKATSGGRRRSSLQAGVASPTDTQQLQTETSKGLTAKLTDLTAAREGKAAMSASQPEVPPLAIPASLQTPVAGDEARKATHGLQAKAEVADNLVLLSSGLSGAMSTAGVASVVASGSAAQFQSVVAQEVAFYVSQDVQSAEIKLEGVGGGPVEVSINMQGKEAQVVFRTDEIQTREMLEGATAQLKDMLQQQGVVLTGVFVGSSGAGDAGQQQERRFRQGARSETTLRIVTPEVRGAGLPADGVGRTLDLYV
ncbi:MAG: flagellar hook-length control protein FliK [Rhodoferax sp.]|nr:flagellar hook-length control protein FliK [Rhodoferax sp.]